MMGIPADIGKQIAEFRQLIIEMRDLLIEVRDALAKPEPDLETARKSLAMLVEVGVLDSEFLDAADKVEEKP